MNREDVPPLDADVLAFLATERPLVVVEAAQRTRGLAAVEALIAGASLGANDAGPGPGAETGSGGAPGHVANGSAFVLAGGKALAAITAAFVAGAVAGGIGVFGLARNEVPLAPQSSSAGPTATAQPTPSQLDVAPTAATSAIAVGDLPDAAVRRAVANPSQEAPVVTAQGLAAERALLDVARSALGRGSPEEALEAANRHSREYPNGLLTEEREALAIRALAGAGNREAAVARASRFRARYPRSLLLPAVEGAVGQGRSKIP